MRIVYILFLQFDQLGSYLSFFIPVMLQVEVNTACHQYDETYHKQNELKLENGCQNHLEESHD